jgi:hypothetical protein
MSSKKKTRLQTDCNRPNDPVPCGRIGLSPGSRRSFPPARVLGQCFARRPRSKPAGGGPKREATLVILDRRKRTCRITLGADKAYDATAFVEEIAINGAVSKHGVVRKTATDGRTIRHAGYGVSQRLDQGTGQPDTTRTAPVPMIKSIGEPKLTSLQQPGRFLDIRRLWQATVDTNVLRLCLPHIRNSSHLRRAR